MNNRILLVGHDVAPTRAFGLLANHLHHSGVSVETIVCGGGKILPPSTEELEQIVTRADIVLIGISFPAENADIEIATGRLAMELGKPFGFYADTFGAWNREWFREFRLYASFLFVINKDEAERARNVFPNASITATGNVLWSDYFNPADRAAVRAEIGANDGEFVILAPGCKEAVINIGLWTSVIEAARGTSWKVLLTKHPGDKTPDDIYAPLLHYAKGMEVSAQWAEKKADDIVPGVDAVVDLCGSVGIHAIARRIPVIDFFGELSKQWLFEATGSRKSFRAIAGASTWVENGSAATLRSAFTRGRTLHEAQEKFLPEAKKGEALKRMAQALLTL